MNASAASGGGVEMGGVRGGEHCWGEARSNLLPTRPQGCQRGIHLESITMPQGHRISCSAECDGLLALNEVRK